LLLVLSDAAVTVRTLADTAHTARLLLVLEDAAAATGFTSTPDPKVK